MPIIAVVNRKGGSGKTTLATHLAVHCAGTGMPVMLADVDRQQSTKAWLHRRASQRLPEGAAITGRALAPNTVLRPTKGFAHVVLDTPGGLRGFDLMRILMYADAVLMPVGVSLFDRESAAECFAEIRALPRVANGRCKLAAVGMRLDPRTDAQEVLRTWASNLQLPLIGFLRDTQTYVRCADRGLTLFDLPEPKVETDVSQWGPILDWLEPVLDPDGVAKAFGRPTSPMTLPRDTYLDGIRRASAAGVSSSAREQTRSLGEPLRPVLDVSASHPTVATRIGKLLDHIAVPRFLQRGP